MAIEGAREGEAVAIEGAREGEVVTIEGELEGSIVSPRELGDSEGETEGEPDGPDGLTEGCVVSGETEGEPVEPDGLTEGCVVSGAIEVTLQLVGIATAVLLFAQPPVTETILPIPSEGRILEPSLVLRKSLHFLLPLENLPPVTSKTSSVWPVFPLNSTVSTSPSLYVPPQGIIVPDCVFIVSCFVVEETVV